MKRVGVDWSWTVPSKDETKITNEQFEVQCPDSVMESVFVKSDSPIFEANYFKPAASFLDGAKTVDLRVQGFSPDLNHLAD